LAVLQVVVSASAGDAITNFALQLRELFGGSEVFAAHRDPALAGDVHLLREFHEVVTTARRNDTIVYHASIGNREVVDFLMSRPERLVLVYHNISPPESFAPYEPEFAALLRTGRTDLQRMRPRVAAAFAVSEYNAADLADLGYTDVQVVPLIFDPSTLQNAARDELTLRHLEADVHGPLALFVGQLLPHKRPELLVESLHVVATYLVPEAHLVLLGARRIPAFAAALQRQIVELGLANAWITGAVSPGALRCYYERADVFVTASDHEGFCVPLLEAMSFGVPIVARGTSAIPETLGRAGLVLGPDEGALVMGEAWALAATDAHARDALVARGSARLLDFDPVRTRQRLVEQLA
jgi:L-malate glycosyltransferase